MHLHTRNVNTAFRDLVHIFNGGSKVDVAYTGKTPTRIQNESPPIIRKQSRNGPVLMIDEPVTVTYSHPRERVLFNAARDANPFFHLYEALWMLAGRNDVESVAYYAKQMKEYSDNGKTLNGAYGYRWRKAKTFVPCERYGHDEDGSGYYYKDEKAGWHDQLDRLIAHLKADPNSRRAVLQMWNVEDDLLKIGQKCDQCQDGELLPHLNTAAYPTCPGCGRGKGQHVASKDVCCNLSVMFSLRTDHCPGCYEGGLTGESDGYAVHIEHQEWGHYDRTEDYPKKPRCRLCKGSRKAPTALDITVTNRSNDLIWGLLGANYVHFTFLQEYMAARLGVEVGKYHHFTNNLHVYTESNSGFKPEEWLADEWNNIPGYTDIQSPLKSHALIKDPAVFEQEVKDFVDRHDGTCKNNPRTIGAFTEPFLVDVAEWAMKAFFYHKEHKDYDIAIECASQIKADDWRIACTQWLQRRKK